MSVSNPCPEKHRDNVGQRLIHPTSQKELRGVVRTKRKKMVKLPSLRELLEAGVHFGHKTSRWFPKMDSYIFGSKSSIHVINLEKTQEKLKEALDYLAIQVKEGKTVVFVGTKKQAQPIVKKAAIESGMPYVVERWLGGTLTNFEIIKRAINKLIDAKKISEGEGFQELKNRDKVKLIKEIVKRDKLVGGLVGLKKAPEILILFGVKDEQNAITEARVKGVKTIGLVDTNANPNLVDFPIPANDDATKSLELFANIFSKTVKENKTLAKDQPAADQPKTGNKVSVPSNTANL